MLARRFLVSATVLLLVAGLCAVPLGATTSEGARQLIETLAQESIATLQRDDIPLEQRETSFRKILGEGFDLDLIGRFVLGPYWHQATPEQREDYLQLFADFFVQTYASRLVGFTGETFAITGTKEAANGDVIVHTHIERPRGPPFEAGWRVRANDGNHRIIDVVVDSVSVAVTQRQEFASVIKNKGLDGLLQMLRARTQRMPASSG